MPALFPPFAAPRSTGCATPSHRHMMPKLWHTPSSADSGFARISSNRPKSGASHDGIFDDALGALRHAVVHRRVEMTGPAGPDIQSAAGAGPGRNGQSPPDVPGDGADPNPRLLQIRRQVADGRPDGHDNRVVADVRPAVIHVQHVQVDDPRIGRRGVLRPVHACV